MYYEQVNKLPGGIYVMMYFFHWMLNNQTDIHMLLVIDDRACENRLWTMKRLNDTDFYLCEVSSNMVIDATNKGNLSRFINHSCEPNTKMQKWLVILYICSTSMISIDVHDT